MVEKLNRAVEIVRNILIAIGLILILGAPTCDYFALSYILRQFAIGLAFIGAGLVCNRLYFR